MSKRACSICSSQHDTSTDTLLVCGAPACAIEVHQACYGVEKVPQHKWFCKRCEPHSLVRASKVRCVACPSREGALKPTTSPDNTLWAHIVCAQWIPELQFDDEKLRNTIDVSKIQNDISSCYICVEEGRRGFAVSGLKVKCMHQSCSKRFHVTCGMKQDLLDATDRDAVYCAQHNKEGMHARRTKAKTKVQKPPKKTTQHPTAVKVFPVVENVKAEKAHSRGMLSGISNAPNFRGTNKDAVVCTCRLCERVYFSLQGLRYHLEHHHGLGQAARTKLENLEDDAAAEDLIAEIRAQAKDFKKRPKAQKAPLPKATQPKASTAAKITPDKPVRVRRSEGKGKATDTQANDANDSNTTTNGAGTNNTHTNNTTTTTTTNHNGSSSSSSSGGHNNPTASSNTHPTHTQGNSSVTNGKEKKRNSSDALSQSENVDAKNMGNKKARILGHSHTPINVSKRERVGIPSVGELPCYAEVVELVPHISETANVMQAEKSAVAKILKDVAEEELSQNSTVLLQRLETLQQHTYKVVGEIGSLLKSRQELQTEISNLKETLPSSMSVLNEKSNNGEDMLVLQDSVHRLESMLLMVLNTFRPEGSCALHPVDLDSVIFRVNDAIGSYQESDGEPRHYVRKVVADAVVS